MNIHINYIIYLYMTACLALMIFNIAYIFRMKRKNRHKTESNLKWHNEVYRQLRRMTEGGGQEPKHTRELSRRLINIDALISYIQAMELIQLEAPEQLNAYLYANYPLFQGLAYKYGRKDSMERAFFADFIRRFPPCHGIEYRPILDILIAYMDNSTVFCRENVLCALYALGNVRAVENALQLLNDRAWFHHPRLISDGLASFTGDKQALAAVLWRQYKKWNHSLMLAVVQFITRCFADYQETFFNVLTDPTTDMEIRLAVMRYFRSHPYEPVRAVLVDCLSSGAQKNEVMAIEAASALARYPGDDTVEALINAISSPNWYVRYNAASSIVDLGAPEAELNAVLQGRDQYAKEILLYKLDQEGYEEAREAVNT